MLPTAIGAHLKKRFDVTACKNVSGGCINDCYEINTSKGKHFLKLNNAQSYPGMFEAEAQGLTTLAKTKTVNVPTVVETGVAGTTSFLLMAFIERGTARRDSMRKLGTGLAQLHKHTQTKFGLSSDNYIGSLPQCNKAHNNWADFFIEMRLQPLVEMAVNDDLIHSGTVRSFEKIYAKLPTLFDEEAPALLHGDLWGGNYIFDQQGEPYILDPAVYYGHREMDIAMTRLFGGFTNDFYEGYNETFLLAAGWRKRIDLWNLYPLLVHVNLFGGGYVGQLTTCLAQYS